MKKSNNELKFLEKICSAWNALDVKILAPYLAPNLVFIRYYVDQVLTNKEEYLAYQADKFRVIADSSNEKVHADIAEENGIKKVFLHGDSISGVYDIAIENGLITKMLLRPATTLFSPDNFDANYYELYKRALRYLDDYFQQNSLQEWGWLQTVPPQIRFQDMCIAYGDSILSIIIGLYTMSLDRGEQIYINQQEYQNQLRECENHHLIPCLLLFDPDGVPYNRYCKGCHLIHSKTLSPIDLENLEDESNGSMSEWEIRNLAVSSVCDLLESEGHTNIEYCDVMEIDPQIMFKYKGEKDAYVIVRSVPFGLSDEKFVINENLLKGLADRKGFFVNVRLNSLKGGSGLCDDKVLYRRSRTMNNLAISKLELVEIEQAIKEYDFIEVVNEDITSI